MSLGERIYKLRSERSLSQGDLAEKLEVSRQSISKWENNSAVPDLDKIVKLSEIFGISIDALVKGESPVVSPYAETVSVMSVEPKLNQEGIGNGEKRCTSDGVSQPTGFPPRMIAGTILLCMAFVVSIIFSFGGILAGVICSLPFLGCGIICFACRQNIGLWCCWLLYMLLDFYMNWATGTNYGTVFAVLRNSVYYGKTWTIHAMVSVVLLLLLLVLIVVTFCRFWKRPLVNSKRNLTCIAIAWLMAVGTCVVLMILPYTGIYSIILKYMMSVGRIYQVTHVFWGWCRVIAFVYALTNTVRYIRTGKESK